MPPVNGLQFVTDDMPGIRRTGTTRFRYVDQLTGERWGIATTLARIRALVVPPAWTDVWICADPRGHLQATGRDARGRKQYRYHAELPGGARGGEVRPARAVRRALPRSAPARSTRPRRAAACRARRWSPWWSRCSSAPSCGSATRSTPATNRIVRPHDAARPARRGRGGEIRFRFAGKGGKEPRASLNDPRLGRLVRRCQDLPGQQLFQYVDEDGAPSRSPPRTSTSTCRERTRARAATAKTFRTWGGTLLDGRRARRGRPAGERAPASAGWSMRPWARSPRRSGNTRAVARAQLRPPNGDRRSFEEGRLGDWWARGAGPRPLDGCRRAPPAPRAGLTPGQGPAAVRRGGGPPASTGPRTPRAPAPRRSGRRGRRTPCAAPGDITACIRYIEVM